MSAPAGVEETSTSAASVVPVEDGGSAASGVGVLTVGGFGADGFGAGGFGAGALGVGAGELATDAGAGAGGTFAFASAGFGFLPISLRQSPRASCKSSDV